MSGRRSPSPRDQRRSDRYSHSDRNRQRSPERRSYTRRERSYSRDRKRYRTERELRPVQGIPILPGESFTEYRTRVRNESKITIWAASPERPRSVSPEEKKRHASDKYASSDEDRKRRHGRHRHRSSKKKSSKKKKYSDTEEEENSSEEDQEVVIEKSLPEKNLDDYEELWVEKQVDLPEDFAPVGPVPLIENDKHNEREYGSALLPGEGSAMAAYVQQGKRIPRRGEIGLSGDQISDFEKAGFVMSGSRHQRMNAVRLRKENQVISAEEKRLVLQHAQEQKLRRENEIISGFREILSDKFKKEDDE